MYPSPPGPLNVPLHQIFRKFPVTFDSDGSGEGEVIRPQGSQQGVRLLVKQRIALE